MATIDRIGLVGAQGVGKTTLVQELSKYLLDYPQIKSVVRSLLNDLGIDSLDELYSTPRTGSKVQRQILEAQMAQEASTQPRFLSERTVIDNWAYWEQYYARYVHRYQNLQYVQSVSAHVEIYDLVVYLPIEFEIESDGFRITDEFEQKEFDYIVNYGLQFFRPKQVLTVRGSVEDRVKMVLEAVNHS